MKAVMLRSESGECAPSEQCTILTQTLPNKTSYYTVVMERQSNVTDYYERVKTDLQF